MNRRITFWHLFFSHHPPEEWNRTLRFKIFEREIVLCTRCTGQYIACFLMLAMNIILGLKPSVVFTYILPLPATADWLTQALQLRESKTWIRLLTGGLFGIWLANFILSIVTLNLISLFHILLQIIIYVTAVMIFFIRKKGSMDRYLKPYEDFVEEYIRRKNKSTIKKNGELY